MDCLALRQKLKETFRARLRKEAGAASAMVASKEKAIISDNHGSFFGPSEIVFADRVVQETKLCSENLFKTDGDHDVAALLKSMKEREKVERIKETRDYSFLSSEKPVARQEILKKNCVDKDGKNSRASDHGIEKKKKNTAKTVESMKKKTTVSEKEIQDPRNSKKTFDFNYLMKGKSSKTLSRVSKKKQVSYIKSKKPCEHVNKSCKEDSVIKEKATTTVKLPQSQPAGIKRKRQEQLKKEYEGKDAISIIRSMFEYDPTKFCSDEDDLNMEVSFADIQKEERRSAKIAKKEDDEELRKIVQQQSKKLKRI